MRGIIDQVRGIRRMAVEAKQAAARMIEEFGDEAEQRIEDLASKSLAGRQISGFCYWKLVREYVRDLRKIKTNEVAS